MRIVMLGKPGSGKGTQSADLAKTAGVPSVATGDIIRRSIAEGTALGREFQSYTQSGRLVPDDLVIALVRERLSEPDCCSGFVLDGFPRTLKQAEGLDDFLFQRGWGLDLIVYLEVSDQDLTERAAGRRWCPTDGSVYHSVFAPPANEGLCDRCGGVLSIREDDRLEVVQSRLREYAEKTAPLVDFYSKRSAFRRVLGIGKIDMIRRQLNDLLLAS